MTFYGESFAIDRVRNVVGAAIAGDGEDITYFYRDALSDTFTAGARSLVGVFTSTYVLTSTDDAVVSWVIECAAGSSGTLRLRSGLDTTKSLTDESLLTEALGDHAASGATRIVVESSLTAANIVGSAGACALSIECISGSVDVLQVRLRAWPPDGPQGAWVSGSAYSQPSSGIRYATIQSAAVGASHASPEAAHAAAAAIFHGYAGTDTPWLRDSSSLTGDFRGAVNKPGTTLLWDAAFESSAALYLWEPFIVSDTTSGTPGGHPDVVPNDGQWKVRAPGGGTLLAGFGGWTNTITTPTVNVAPVGSAPGLMRVYQTPVDPDDYPIDGFPNRAGPWVDPEPGGGYATGASVPLASHPALVVVVSSDVLFTIPGEEHEEWGSVTFPPAAALAAVGEHEWFDPGLPWQPELTPRFFVKDYEGDWRPVGFGKPASDPSVFRVWTPVGWYEECRDGDTYSNAHPLKVKLHDGTWDTVAHMRPV